MHVTRCKGGERCWLWLEYAVECEWGFFSDGFRYLLRSRCDGDERRDENGFEWEE